MHAHTRFIERSLCAKKLAGSSLLILPLPLLDSSQHIVPKPEKFCKTFVKWLCMKYVCSISLSSHLRQDKASVWSLGLSPWSTFLVKLFVLVSWSVSRFNLLVRSLSLVLLSGLEFQSCSPVLWSGLAVQSVSPVSRSCLSIHSSCSSLSV